MSTSREPFSLSSSRHELVTVKSPLHWLFESWGEQGSSPGTRLCWLLLSCFLPEFWQFSEFVTSIGELNAGGGSTICLLYGLLAEGIFA